MLINSTFLIGNSPTNLSVLKTPMDVILGTSSLNVKIGKIGSRPTSSKKSMNFCKLTCGKRLSDFVLFSMVSCKNISMNIGQFLHDTIEKSTKYDNLFPQVSLQKYMLYLEDVRIDPNIPIFTFKEEVPKITSIGVFKTDKLVGELPIKNVELINILYHRVKQAWIEVSIPTEPFQDELKDEVMKQQEDISLNLSIKKNKSNTKLIDKENLKFETNIKLNVNLIESSVYESLNMED